MKVRELFTSVVPADHLALLPDISIYGIEEDSRRIRPGDLFVARAGTKTDGAKYVADAAARGAAAALVAQKSPDCSIPQIVLADLGRLISPLAQRLYGDPSRSLKVLAVTGTNGKTTTTYLVRHILAKLGMKCGMIGTVELDDGKTVLPAEMTTPSPTNVARLMAAMRDNGCVACAIEVSSHALDQDRIAGVSLAAAAFTNLTGDHLDYHKTMARYAAAKARLFEMLPAEAPGIANARDEWSMRILRDCPGRRMYFGMDRPAEYRASNPVFTAQGTAFTLTTPRGTCDARMRLIGRHNIENALTAASLVGEGLGLSAAAIADGLSDAMGAPGRLQPVEAGQSFAVLVDYAHTDDAMQNVLNALRPLTQGRLRVLFGCGGDRDTSKRPRMAQVAENLADAVYVTSDNPRTERPEMIMADIVAGFSAAGKQRAVVQPDRRAAIAKIIGDAEAGDVVLLAGKGHENYQIVGATKHHFDDVEEATKAIEAIGAIRCRS